MNLTKLNKNPVAWYTSGTILRQLTAFVMLPVYTTYLAPEEYGIVGLLSVILGIYELFLGARFGAALPKFYYDKSNRSAQRTLVSTALICTTIMSAVGSGIFALSSSFLATDFFERSDLTFALAAYGLTLLTSAIEEYALVYFRLKNKPFFFFVMSISKLALQLTLNIYFLVYAGMGVEGVIFSSVISSVVFGTISMIYILIDCGLGLEISESKALFHFTWPLWLSGLASIYITAAINFLFKYFASLEEVGIYHFALKFSSLIALLIWRPFNQWWQTERFKLAKELERPQTAFSAAFMLIGVLMCIGAFGISTFVGSVIKLMADDAYQAATQIVPILCIMVVFNQFNFFLNFSLLKSGKTKFFPKVRFFKALLITLLVMLFTMQWQLKGGVLALLICQLVEFSIMYWLSKKHWDQGVPLLGFLIIIAWTVLAISITNMHISLNTAFWPRLGELTLSLTIYLLGVWVFLFTFTNYGRKIINFTKKRI